MTVFWLHGEELMFGGNGVHPVQQRIPQMKMMKVHIPFTFKLHETSNSSYSGIYLNKYIIIYMFYIIYVPNYSFQKTYVLSIKIHLDDLNSFKFNDTLCL